MEKPRVSNQLMMEFQKKPKYASDWEEFLDMQELRWQSARKNPEWQKKYEKLTEEQKREVLKKKCRSLKKFK